MTNPSKTFGSHWYFGGISSATACLFTHPVDVVQLQVQSKVQNISVRRVVRLILENRGPAGFYYTIGTSVRRQLFYVGARFGMYDYAREHGLTRLFWQKTLVAATCGGLLGAVCAPIEKAYVRMRTDLIRRPHTRRNYASVWHGISRMYVKGGIRYIFGEALISSLRGMMMGIGQLSVYDEVKLLLIQTAPFSDNQGVYWIASFTAGGIAAILTTPFEVLKVIAMDAKYRHYSGCMHVAQELAELYGSLGFFKGTGLTCIRVIPQTIITFLIYEKLRVIFKKDKTPFDV